LNKYLEKIGKPILDAELSILKNYGQKRLTVREREELLTEIGLGMVSPSNIVRAVYQVEDLLKSTQQIQLLPTVGKNLTSSSLGEVIVDGQTGIPFRFATCCTPKFGDSIVGYISRQKAVSVHKMNCRMVLNSNQDRLISVAWANVKKSDVFKYRVNLVIELEDRVGMLRDITNIISDQNINIVDLSLGRTNPNELIKLRNVVIEVNSYDQLETLLNKLERIPDVLSVKKVD
jgi:GTP pyrophosphokinase